MLKTSSFRGETWGIRHWEFSTMDRLRGAGHRGLTDKTGAMYSLGRLLICRWIEFG